MFGNVPQRARLAERYGSPACLDLAADGLADRFRNDPGLIFALLFTLTSEQFPHTGRNVKEKHGVVREQVRPNFP